MIKQITRDVVDKIIDKSRDLAFYAHRYDMDLSEISDYNKTTRELLDLLGDMLEFDPYEDEEDEGYEEDIDDDESSDNLTEQLERLRNWIG